MENKYKIKILFDNEEPEYWAEKSVHCSDYDSCKSIHFNDDRIIINLHGGKKLIYGGGFKYIYETR